MHVLFQIRSACLHGLASSYALDNASSFCFKVRDCTFHCTTSCLLIRVRVGLCVSPNRKCNPAPHSVSVPTTGHEKDPLDLVGLGMKKITIPNIDCTIAELRDILLDSFPPLKEAGGFEFLRCKSNSRILEKFSDLAQSSPKVLADRSGT